MACNDDETRLGGAPSVGATDSAPAMGQIGPYRLIGVLGEGGMGRVYEAEQASPRRRVALKVIRGALVDDLQIRMFQREAETLGRLEHPNIGAIYESGRTDDGQHFFAMELVRGRTLAAFLDDRGALDAAELRFRLSIFGVIADAVHYAHQRGVIHRDLKPSNVIVATGTESSMTVRRGSSIPTVKILDFGLARLADAEQATTATDVGVIKGTLAYMSPEQARGGAADVDVRSDVYALGVVLYEMLTGRRPYDTQRGSLLEAVRVICEDAPIPLVTVWPGPARLDPDIATIIGKALEKDPARRYASAVALAEDVDRYLTSQPILARPPSAAYQLRRFAQRHRGLVAAVAAILVVVVTGGAAATWQAVRATRAEALASRRAEDALAAQAVAESRRVEAEAARALADERRQQAESATAAALAARQAEAAARVIADERRTEAERATAEAEAARTRETAERRRADASAADARDEAGKAGAINDFLINDLLSSIMPSSEVGRGRDVLMKEVIDEASRRLGDAGLAGGRFEGQPVVEAAVRLSIGRTYRVLGEFDRAQPHLERALALRERALGRSALATQEAVSELGLVLHDRGRTREAEPLLQEVLNARLQQGAPRLDVARAKGNLGLALMGQRRFEEAETLMREAEETLDPSSASPELVFGIRNNLGVLYLDTSRPAEALDLFTETRAALMRTVGPNAPATIMATSNMASAYRQLGRTREAMELMTELLPTARKVAGDTHPAVLTGVVNLAAAWNALGTPQKTVAEMPDALAAARATLGPQHPTTVLAMMALGEAYSNVGQPDKATPLLSDSVAGFRAAGTADTRDGLLARTLLVRSLIGRGRAAAAIEDMRRIVARTEALDGFEALPAVLARQLLGFVLQAANDTPSAVPLIESTLGALEAMPDEPQARIAAIEGRAALSRVRFQQNRLDDALRLFEQAVAAAEAEGDTIRGLVYRLKAELGNLYVISRQPVTKAEPMLRAAFEGLSATLGPAHPAAIGPLFDLWALARRDRPKREIGALEMTLAPRLRAAVEAPEPSVDTLGRASILLRLAIAPGIRDLPRALALAERAVASGSGNVSAWAALAEARLAVGQRAGAITAFERAASLAPPGAGRSGLEARIKELKR